MREKIIEQRLVKVVMNNGGVALKLASPTMNGLPDRLVLLPGGRLCFVEVKAPGRIPRPLQIKRHQRLRDLGFLVFVLDDPNKIEEVLAWCK